MILQFDDAQNIITLLDICERDYEFRKLVEKELQLAGLKRNLTKKTRELIVKGVWASIGMSLNYEIEEAHTVEDNIVDEERNTEELVMKKLEHEKLFSSIDRLSQVEQNVITRRFGLLGYSPMSYKEVGMILGLYGLDVENIEHEALEKLRRYISDEPLIEDYKGMVALLLAISWGQ